jgi:4-hydroxythreonine-4-phosphate dehydrogenase
MIYVTQGHEKGIGLEVYLKSILQTPKLVSETILICELETLQNTLNTMSISYDIKDDILRIGNINQKLHIIKSQKYTETLTSLLKALEVITEQDVLFTLPTSKDQLVYENKNFAGYTEFLRFFYNKPNLVMSFWGPSHNQALITDHIPLKKISTTITPGYFMSKMKIILQSISKQQFKQIYISGINPHAGEGGILGDEEQILTPTLEQLRKEYPMINISDFISGDTLHTYKSEHTFFIYMYHDQGLSRFKSENQLIGVNATLGLPFLRVSVDHGTAFNLYRKDCADHSGCHYTLLFAMDRNHGK